MENENSAENKGETDTEIGNFIKQFDAFPSFKQIIDAWDVLRELNKRTELEKKWIVLASENIIEDLESRAIWNPNWSKEQAAMLEQNIAENMNLRQRIIDIKELAIKARAWDEGSNEIVRDFYEHSYTWFARHPRAGKLVRMLNLHNWLHGPETNARLAAMFDALYDLDTINGNSVGLDFKQLFGMRGLLERIRDEIFTECFNNDANECELAELDCPGSESVSCTMGDWYRSIVELLDPEPEKHVEVEQS